MMKTYCEFSDLPVEQCALPCCLDLPDPGPKGTPVVSHPFRARFDGRCRQTGCRNEISKGDLIRYVEDLIACGSCS